MRRSSTVPYSRVSSSITKMALPSGIVTVFIIRSCCRDIAAMVSGIIVILHALASCRTRRARVLCRASACSDRWQKQACARRSGSFAPRSSQLGDPARDGSAHFYFIRSCAPHARHRRVSLPSDCAVGKRHPSHPSQSGPANHLFVSSFLKLWQVSKAARGRGESDCVIIAKRRLTLRSTGPAGSCLDLRSPSARRAGYLAR